MIIQSMSVMGVSTKGNAEQAELCRLIMDRDHHIIIGVGAAGTGKNFISIATALQLVLDKKYSRIYYTRNASEVGRSLGYLKGDMDKKFGPYTAPLQDTLESIQRASELKLNLDNMWRNIQTIPTGYIRGRNLDDCIFICDECQNLSLTELQTLITRMGEHSKIVLLGSFNQVDETAQLRKEKCDFQTAAEALMGLDYVGFVKLEKSMRSPWCAEIDELFENLKKAEKQQ